MRGIVLGLLLFASTIQAQVILEAFGDSLTAGFMVRSQVTTAPSLASVSEILSDFATFSITKDVHYILKHEDRSQAWPSVLAKLFKKNYGEVLPVENYGVSGAQVAQLIDEMNLAPLMASNRVSFFFIGHNDLARSQFNSEDVSYFLETYENALNSWDGHRENSDAFIVPIANVPKVFKTLKGYVWHQSSARGTYRCEDSWEKLFPYGKHYSQMQRQGLLEPVVSPILNGMNLGLKTLVANLNKNNGRNRYHFVNLDKNSVMSPHYFSVDCYHLSSEGQKALAEWIYNASVN